MIPSGDEEEEGGDSDPSESSDQDDETMSAASSSSTSTYSTNDDREEASCASITDATPPVLPCKGVTFNEQVRVLPIPPIEDYTPEQRYRMYANRFEVRENKIRNKREYEFDNYDWRNATEENAMAICPMSGELLHPAHL
ncbi:hypothetical protein ACHAXA_004657 [Cyclostephanos tholiformis]|uniref:Uncharacterized protein n=1 Tax=Cyclostephanos tholiformis TaxID=382380 RepID=A0ABD3R8L7_9STRA